MHSGRQSGGGTTRHSPAPSARSRTAARYTRGSWNSREPGRKTGAVLSDGQPSGRLRRRSRSGSPSCCRDSSFSRSHSRSRSAGPGGLGCRPVREEEGEEVEREGEAAAAGCWGSEVVPARPGFWPGAGEEEEEEEAAADEEADEEVEEEEELRA